MRFAVIILLGTACSTPAPDDPPVSPDVAPEPPPATGVLLTPTQHLTRASLVIRGVRPSVADLEAVDADPGQLGTLVDRYLASPGFGAMIRDLENETLLLRVEEQNLTFPYTATFSGPSASAVNASIFEEPLRLIEDIVTSDQPYTKIVTADYTMADETVAQIWGLSRPATAAGWQRATWPDARGAAGILGVEAIYHRHRSAGFNYNRGRANVISSALLCHDYAHADIQVDTSIDLADPEVVANAVVQNASCAGCHQTLDPLASYLFPFRNSIQIGPISRGEIDYPVGGYLAARRNLWQSTNKRPPMFFGDEAVGLAGLGQAIAADPRFARCTATRFASYLTEVPTAQLDGRWIARLQGVLEGNGFNARKLVREIVLSDEFRISHDTDAARAEEVVGLHKLRPQQLSRMLRDLTGFAWTTATTHKVRNMPYGEPDLLDSDVLGFRVLAGGIDSYYVTESVHTVTATSSLVTTAVASSAADFVVEHDASVPAAQRTLFTAAAVGATDEPTIRAQLALLHARIYGELVDPGSPDVDESFALFTAARAASNQRRAWKVVLVGMLTDARALYF